ncbi:aryl-sulfate sulfotransferase [Sphingobacterium sp. UT-1RO-CII-1]|uniref:aryl-sulfate sulfotransferase n=1 Tax=Sphingobacterium sp. UT-1RO-CII-1 TaxID=2995225 RepID=UPI00227AF402|nr:aryl-sulfate sulfotransferase [Sphingobacterium sp. UT-1RO-CII-1]MCY4779625.1 aryl-sulfate sulfotransferase [Sphingobacterium sp. UT-1RO-CII-1]
MRTANVILVLYKVIALCAISLLYISCSKEEQQQTDVAAVQIFNDPSSALVARVVVSLNTSRTIKISCYNENKQLVYNNVSFNKQTHNVSLLQLKEKTNYYIEVAVLDEKSEFSTIEKVNFTTAAIPSWVTDFYSPDLNKINDPLNGYYLFANMKSPGCIYMINSKGEIVWYKTTEAVVKSVHATPKGSVLAILDQNGTNFGDGNIVLETSLAGDTLFHLEYGKKGFDKWVHHDLAINPQGNIIAVTNTFQGGFPGDGLVEWSSSGNKVWEWSTFDVQHEIDPNIQEQPWVNSVFIDHDGHYLLSLRALDQVWKVHSSSGKVLWKLGKNGNIKMDQPIHFLRQHYAHRNHQGELMLFDNGSDERPYSRVLSYTINEENLTGSISSITDLPKDNYSPIMGSAFLLPDNNILTASSSSLTALKLDPLGNTLFKLKFKSPIYRIEYIPSSIFIK